MFLTIGSSFLNSVNVLASWFKFFLKLYNIQTWVLYSTCSPLHWSIWLTRFQENVLRRLGHDWCAFLHLTWCFTSTETVWLIMDGGRMGWDPRHISLFTQLLSSGCAFQEGRQVYLSHSNTVGAALAETAHLQVTEDEADRYILLQEMPFNGSFNSHCLSEPVAEPLLTLIDVLLEVWRFIAWQSEGRPSTSQPRCSWRNRYPAPWWPCCCALHWWGCWWDHPFINRC